MRTPLRIRPVQSGFSLIEIVIVLVLLSFLGVLGARMISGSVLTNQLISSDKKAYSAARYALERMSREIRETEYLSASDTMNITVMSSTQLSFYKTTLSTTTPVTLTYDSTKGELYLAYNTGTPTGKLLLTNLVSTAPFKYLDASGNILTLPLNDPTSLRYIRIDLDVKPDNAQSQLPTLSTQIYFRNR
jgi:prepilin-type N-terminal cleavage/methylation domain-containing protein